MQPGVSQCELILLPFNSLSLCVSFSPSFIKLSRPISQPRQLVLASFWSRNSGRHKAFSFSSCTTSVSPRESWLAARNESGIAVEAIQVLTGYKTGEKLGAAIAPVRARTVRIDIKGSHVHARRPARCCSRRGIPGSSQHLDSCSRAVATWLYPVGAGCRALKILRDEPRTHCVFAGSSWVGSMQDKERKNCLTCFGRKRQDIPFARSTIVSRQ